MTTPAITIERWPDHVAIVTLCRPEASNAVTPELARQLEAAVRMTEADADIWVVILTGAGDRAFCAGADLKEVAAGRVDDLRTAEGGFAGFVDAHRHKPWIAAVNGAALGGGCEIVLACDMVVAAEHARLGLPEVLRGLVAGAGGLYRLPRAIPPNIALELIATARPMSAAEGHRWGWINRVAAPGRLLPEVLALAGEITRNAPVAVRESLRVARATCVLDDARLRELNEHCRATVRASTDHAEGVRAFIEKRVPCWTGH